MRVLTWELPVVQLQEIPFISFITGNSAPRDAHEERII